MCRIFAERQVGMTTFSQTACCDMLGVDPKTLRQWIKQAQVQLVVDPVDARCKCLSEEQVRKLASLHEVQVPFLERTNPASIPDQSGSQACMEEVDLSQKVALLETKINTLHEQLAQLALQLLSERHLHLEQRLSGLEALLAHILGTYPSLPAPPDAHVIDLPPAQQNVARRLHSAEQRVRSHVLPLIEYGAQGSYVVVCPKEGVLPFRVDSVEWFDWLATLVSFRFMAPAGRFTAYRHINGGRRVRTWIAHRYFHGRMYKTTLGVTDHLTVARLEQAAAQLHEQGIAH